MIISNAVDVHDPAIYIDTMLVKYHLREVTSEWRSFGIQLGVPFQELKAIDQGRLTPMDCVEELLDAWIHRRGKDAKITDVIRACRSIGDHSLADNLEKHEVVKNIMSRSKLNSFYFTITTSGSHTLLLLCTTLTSGTSNMYMLYFLLHGNLCD